MASGEQSPNGAAGAAADRSGGGHGHGPLAMIVGFVPWIAYWAMVGSVSFRLSVSIAFALSLALTAGAWMRGERPKVLEAGSAIVFALIVLVAFATDDRFLERWIQPLTNAGLFAIVAGSLAIGRPFTLEYAREEVSPEVAALPGFIYVNRVITAVWAGAFAVMTLSSIVPPAVEGEATLREGGSTLSVLGYWVVPFTALGLAGLFSARFPDRFTAGLDEAPAVRPAAADLLALPAPEESDGLLVELAERARVDELPAIAVRGAEPGAEVTLTAELEDVAGEPWRSTARYRADDAGRLDAGRDSPTNGPGDDRAPGEPLWSMDPLDPRAGIYVPPASAQLTVVAESGGRRAGARGERLLIADGVRVEEIREEDVIGRLHLPPGSGPHPAVAVFGGSEGGIDNSLSHSAALLASHGYASLVVGLFGAPGLPEELVELPLERFHAGIRRLAADPGVDAAAVGALAISKGAEGLLAALALEGAPRVGGVVAISPSAAVWQAVGDEGPAPGRSSWSAAGRPVPFAEMDAEATMHEMLRNALLRGIDRRRHRPTLLHLASTFHFDRLPSDSLARIRAERIEAPLLLLSGEDDELWPSGAMAAAIAERRRAHGGSTGDGDESRSYPGAGHLLRMPLIPTTGLWADGIAFGGTAAGLAAAQADLGPRVLGFLNRSIGPGQAAGAGTPPPSGGR